MRSRDFQTPGVLVVADETDRTDWLADAAEACGARVLERVSLAEAGAAIARRAHADTVLVALPHELPESGWEALIALATRERCLIEASGESLDRAWALLAPLGGLFMSDPSLAERCEAVADVLDEAMTPALLAESDGGAIELRRLSGEAARIADLLERFATEADVLAAVGAAEPSAAQIRAILRARRLRDRFFEPGLFADPAWDMLLDLMAARIEGGAVSVSSLCIAAAVPPTTALRWIRALLSAGLCERRGDPDDRRRAFVALADRTADRLAAYFTELARLRLPGA